MLKELKDYNFFNNKNILITGGTGTIGKMITEYLLSNTGINKIVIFSRDEFKQFEMRKNFSKFDNSHKLKFKIGNICDINNTDFCNIDIVIHAAALKQIDTVENNAYESIKTNIIGTQNVINACTYAKVKMLVGISTDKSVSPTNLYGATKLCLERLVVNANNEHLKTCVLRYGNVFNVFFTFLGCTFFYRLI